MVDLRGYSQDEFERQYNPRVAVPDHQAKIDSRAAASAAARSRLNGVFDVRYGPGPKETLDIFRPTAAGGKAPVHIYFHGGYWRAQDKADVTFMAEPLVAAGAVVVIANYDLCPDVRVSDIVLEAVRAIAWTYLNIGQYGGDPDGIYISGNSAGGHLCAMALAHDWTADDLPADVVKGAVLLTGVYDPEPVLGISVNDLIRLTPDQVDDVSPMKNPPLRALPLAILVGAAETEEWIRQSRDYSALCRGRGIDHDYQELPGEDHFTMTAVLGEPDKPAVKAILAQMGLSG